MCSDRIDLSRRRPVQRRGPAAGVSDDRGGYGADARALDGAASRPHGCNAVGVRVSTARRNAGSKPRGHSRGEEHADHADDPARVHDPAIERLLNHTATLTTNGSGPSRHHGGMALSFRPLERGDFSRLSEWLGAPHVKGWWRAGHTLAAIEAKYGPRVDGTEPTEVFVAEADGEPVGLIQRYRIRDYPDWERAVQIAAVPMDAVGIDYLLGDPALIGRGLGGQIIREFVQATWRQLPDASAIAVSVQQANRQSWRALEKAGFRRAWEGLLESDDPSDEGPSYIYLRDHPDRAS